MDQILKVLSVCESQNSDTDQLEYQPRHTLPRLDIAKPRFCFLNLFQASIRRLRRHASPDLQVTCDTRSFVLRPLCVMHVAGVSSASCAAPVDHSLLLLQRDR